MILEGVEMQADHENDVLTIVAPVGARVIIRSHNQVDQQTIIIRRAWQPGDEL